MIINIKNKKGLKSILLTGLLYYGRIGTSKVDETPEVLTITVNDNYDDRLKKTLEFFRCEIIKDDNQNE